MKAELQSAWRRCQKLSLSAGGQFAALMILLGRLAWGMWGWRDLTYGDTSRYYSHAMQQLSGARVSLVFSPLYVTFYGWFGGWFESAHTATWLHRVAILALLGVSLLLLARTLLPRPVAWLVAAWWLVLPIDWNALYEVHLFGFIPLALGCWMMGGYPRRLCLSVGLASIWAGALLVRNEYVLSVALLAACCVIRECAIWRRAGESRVRLLSGILALALPSLLVTAAAAVEWRSSWPGWTRLRKDFNNRHTLNMAQVYPFSYQQRHPSWRKSPWTEGEELMQEHFGQPRITFSDAFRKNPRAIWDHVTWHLALLPAGLQLGLFNGHFGAFSPDFTPPRQQPMMAAALSVALASLLLGGIVCIRKDHRLFRRFFRSRRGWSWLALLGLLPPCFVAIITQRPRPSYIFPLNFLVMAVAGLCLFAVLRRLRLWTRFKAAFPLGVLAVILAAAPERTTAQIYAGQPLRQFYERLLPFRSYLQGSTLVFASREFTWELASYLNLKPGKRGHTRSFTLGDACEQTAAEFDDALQTNGVTILYLGPADLDHPAVADWLLGEKAHRWKILARHDWKANRWMLLARESVEPAAVRAGP